MPDPLIGLDVYHGNPDLTADQLRPLNVAFLVSKATQYLASYSLDAKYLARKALAATLGVPFFGYAFGDGIDGGIQADHFLKEINPQGDVGLVLDLEANMNRAQANAFVAWIYKYTGVWPMVYTNVSYPSFALGITSSDTIAQCPLWIAGDPSANGYPILPSAWIGYVLWQRPPSLLLGLDTDYFYGDKAALMTLFHLVAGTYSLPSFKKIYWAVPYNSQWADEEAATTYQFKDDCGVAALMDLLDFYKLAHDELGTMGSKSRLAQNNDAGLYSADVAMLAALYGLTLTLYNGQTIDQLNAYLEVAPLIAMVNEQAIRAFTLPKPVQDATALLHFLVITGFDGTNYTVNDPDFWGAREADGHDFVIPADALIAGLNQMVTPGQLLIPTPPGTPPVVIPPTNGGPAVQDTIEMIVNAPGVAPHNTLIVHTEPRLNDPTSWLYAPTSDPAVSSPATLVDQTHVTVESAPINGFYRIAAGDASGLAGNYLLGTYLTRAAVTLPTQTPRPATVNYLSGLYVHYSPDTLVTSRVPNLGLVNAQTINVLPNAVPFYDSAGRLIPMYQIDPADPVYGSRWVDGALLSFPTANQ